MPLLATPGGLTPQEILSAQFPWSGKDLIPMGKLWLGAFNCPGVQVIRGGNSPRRINSPDAYGIDGATSTYVGSGLAKPVAEVRLWLPVHFELWEIFARGALRKPINLAPMSGAIGIVHPTLNMHPWCISAVIVEDVTQFVQNDTGLWTCEIHMIEFRKSKPALARQIAAIPAVEVALPVPLNSVEEDIARYRIEIDKLGG